MNDQTKIYTSSGAAPLVSVLTIVKQYTLVAILFAFVSLIDTGYADAEKVGDWLMRMNNAANKQSYRGIFVMRHGDEIESMQIVHDAHAQGVRERLFSLNGEPREVIRDQQQVWCYLPYQGMGVHQPSASQSESRFPELLPTEISILEKNYDILIGESGRVADRQVTRIDIKPRDAFRYGHMLWIDAETGLILKADRMGLAGEALEQYQFVEIEYLDIVEDRDLAPKTPKENLEWHNPVQSMSFREISSAPQHWQPEQLPPGFSRQSFTRQKSDLGDGETYHAVYSDGLATVSMFVNPLPANGSDADQIQGPSTMGAVSAFGVVIDNHQVTAMGEVPVETVKLFATSAVSVGSK